MRAGDDGVRDEDPVPPGGGGDGGRKRTAAEEEKLKRQAVWRNKKRVWRNNKRAGGNGRVWIDMIPKGKEPKYDAPARTVTSLVPKQSRPTPPQPRAALGPTVSTTVGGGTMHARSMPQLELHARLVDAQGLLSRQSEEIQTLRSELDRRDVQIQELESRTAHPAQMLSAPEPSQLGSRFKAKKRKHAVIVGYDEADKIPMLQSALTLARHLTQYAAAEGEVAIIHWGVPCRIQTRGQL